MNIEEAESYLNEMAKGAYINTAKRIDIASTLQCEILQLRAKLNDRLPNGGMVSHGAKHSMKPTIENDKS